MGKRKRKHIKQLTWSQLWSKLKKLGRRTLFASWTILKEPTKSGDIFPPKYSTTRLQPSGQLVLLLQCRWCRRLLRLPPSVRSTCRSAAGQESPNPAKKSLQDRLLCILRLMDSGDEDEFFVDDEEESDVEAASEGSAREEESATDE
ncbi:hypothetical protein PI125_g3136 [Phytophthora idaei]|nr:hypothetical protein PI125_g3136 [Phytophthora idaei]